MRIAVTGASGFVGQALVIAGAEAGHVMRAVTRDALAGAAGAPRGVSLGETAVIRDLTDAAALRSAFAACDAVVHLAARVHVMHAEGAEALARFRAVNVEGARSVMEAARAVGVRRLVLLSTAKVLGEGRAGAVLDDAAPPCPEGAYAESKAEMERLVRGSSLDDWTLIRPPLVYGAGVGGNFRRLLQLARIGGTLPLPLGAVRNRRSMVYVRNLTHAVLQVLGDDRARGRAYLVSDGEDVSTPDLLRRIALAQGERVRLFSLPPGALRAALRLVGRGAEAERLLESFTVDSSAIRRELGWLPPHTLDDGIAETARWWQERAS